MYPVLWEFELFGNAVTISSFGLLVAIGFLAGGRVAEIYFNERGEVGDKAWRVLVYCMIGGILGSKLWYAAESVARGNPGGFIELAFLNRGGMTWYGGFVGGILGGALGARVARVPVFMVANATAPALLVGQMFGRIGCFLVGDDWGSPSNLPWAVAFPDGIDPTHVPVHPTQLYEVAWLAAGALLLWTRRNRSPALFSEYLMIAGIGRLWIEVFRVNPLLLGPLTNAQLMAIGCALLGAMLWLRFRSLGLSDATPR